MKRTKKRDESRLWNGMYECQRHKFYLILAVVDGDLNKYVRVYALSQILDTKWHLFFRFINMRREFAFQMLLPHVGDLFEWSEEKKESSRIGCRFDKLVNSDELRVCNKWVWLFLSHPKNIIIIIIVFFWHWAVKCEGDWRNWKIWLIGIFEQIKFDVCVSCCMWRQCIKWRTSKMNNEWERERYSQSSLCVRQRGKKHIELIWSSFECSHLLRTWIHFEWIWLNFQLTLQM